MGISSDGRLVLSAVLAALHLAGCSGSTEGGAAAAGGGGETLQPSSGGAGRGATPPPVSSGGSDGGGGEGCACSFDTRGAATLSLDCFCAEFPTSCPTYEELEAERECFGGASEWLWTRHEGCGQITLRFDGGFGGVTHVYDAATRALIGVSTYSDVPFGSCQAYVNQAGVPPRCAEGEICAACGETETCLPACSIEAYRATGRSATYENVAAPVRCADATDEVRAELRLGCGHATVTTSPFGTVFDYDAESHELLGVHAGSDASAWDQCRGSWGAPVIECPSAAVCSLCDGDAAVCPP